MKPDRFDIEGRCTLCKCGWLCDPCKSDNAARERKLSENLGKAVKASRGNEIARLCMRYQLESDEFLTREQKALCMIERGAA